MAPSVTPELLSALCHELRGPLGALGNWAHVLNVPEADPSVRARALDGLAEDVRAMSALIDQVSTLASVLSGPKAEMTPIDLDSCLRGLVEATARESGPKTALHVSEPSLRVLGDPAGLREMLRLFLDASPRATDLTVTTEGAAVIVSLTLDRPPRPLSLALARALSERQGGDVVTANGENRTLLRFRLPRAS